MKNKIMMFAILFMAVALVGITLVVIAQQQKIITLPSSHLKIIVPNSEKEMQIACFLNPMNPVCLCKEKPYCIEALLYSIRNKSNGG